MKTDWLTESDSEFLQLSIGGTTTTQNAQWDVSMEHYALGDGLITFMPRAVVREPVVLDSYTNLVGPWVLASFNFSGRVNLLLSDDADVPLHGGQVVFCSPADWRFRYTFPVNPDLRQFSFCVRADVIERLMGDHLPAAVSPLFVDGATDSRVVNFKLSPEMRALVSLVMKNELTGNLRALQLEGLIMQLLALIAAQAGEDSRPNSDPRVTKRDLDAVGEVCERIAADPGGGHTLGSLAAAVNMNERRLNHIFRGVFDMSVLDKLKNERMEAARRVLETEDVKLKQISHRVGYAHVSNFVRAFTAHFGMPPKQYARQSLDWTEPAPGE